MNAAIVIPAFNEAAVIYKVVKFLPKKLKGIKDIRVVVVDDGSTDDTRLQAKKAGAIVLRHPVNRGVGAATKTGIEWARKQSIDLLITFDADGQHNPIDIPRLIKPIIKNEADLVIGSRFKRQQSIPLDRLILNWSANLITFMLFGIFSTDSQSGLRAMSKRAIRNLNFKNDRMEFSTEVLIEAKRNKLKTREVPTSAVYTVYSRKKGQKNTNAFPIFIRFLVKWLR
ncbi:MAG: glycosyltransferase family 2 protein [Patescibacteria group bacterium]